MSLVLEREGGKGGRGEGGRGVAMQRISIPSRGGGEKNAPSNTQETDLDNEA